MNIQWSDVATIATALAGILGGVRWLLSVYYKQQIKLDAARKEAFSAQIELLRNELDDMREEVRHDINEIIYQVEELTKAYRESKIAADKVLEALKDFVVSVKEKFKKYDSVVVKEEPIKGFGKVKIED